MRRTIFLKSRDGIGHGYPLILFIVIALMCALSSACSKPPTVTEEPKDFIVNAPANGVVRRVLVVIGTSLEKDAALIEIGVPQRAAQTGNSNADLAARAAETNLAAAAEESKRTLAEVHRIEPLVKKGLASKTEMNKALAQSQDAEERLTIARLKVQNANRNRPPAPEEIITVRVPSAGIVRQFSVQVGDNVLAGQPLATIASRS